MTPWPSIGYTFIEIVDDMAVCKCLSTGYKTSFPYRWRCYNNQDIIMRQLRARIQRECIKFGNFTLASGKESEYYIDLRPLILSHPGLKEVEDLLSAVINGYWDMVGGPACGAIPIATAIARKMNRDIFYTREPKGHGSATDLVGPSVQGMRCILVEDVVTTGGSLRRSMEVVEAAGGEVTQILCVLDRGCEDDFDGRLTCLFKTEDFSLEKLNATR